MHQAYVVEGEGETGVSRVEAFIEKELGMKARSNPDVIVLRYGLFSAEDARRIAEIAASAPIGGTKKAIVIAANRAYHEAQNALLKIFEEPAPGTYLFLVLPMLGGLLLTLRSRVGILHAEESVSIISEAAKEFLNASREKRSAIAKKLAIGKDEDERREHRDEVIAIINGIEATAYTKFKKQRGREAAALLSDISVLRSFLYDRSAPLRMILEHLAIVAPRDLV